MANSNLLPLDEGYVLQGKRHRYTIKKTLGRGGFGITYFAEETVYEGNIPQKHEFAIKEFAMSEVCSRDVNKNIVFPLEKDDVEACKQDFIKEAERLNNISHPGIVPVNEIIYGNNTVYYVMQHLGSMSLTRFIKERGGRLDESSARRVIRQVAEAVNYLHNQRITHLDIKPDNIMIVDPEGQAQPVLIDFGLAGHYNKSNGKVTSILKVMGISEGYSPIEQYLGLDRFTPQADIYAMGATFFYMLTGKDPVKASEMSNRYIYANLPDNISDQTGLIVTGCMQKQKEQRLQSVESIISMLDGNSPNVSPDVSVNKRATQLIKSRKTARGSLVQKKFVYGGITAALVAVVIGLVLMLSGKDDTQPELVLDNGAVVSENAQTETLVESEEKTPTKSAINEITSENQGKPEEVQRKDKDKQPEKTETQTMANPSTTTTTTSTSTTTVAPKAKNPRWGLYVGARNSEGLPHGNGVINITGSTTLKGVAVSSGDRIKGLFRDGYLNFGTLYLQDGTEVKLKDINLF